MPPDKVIELKTMILNPSNFDKLGYSDLNRRAFANSQLAKDGIDKLQEEELVVELGEHLHDFKSYDISRLITYVKESKFSDQRIFDKYLAFILQEDILNVFQRTEIIRFLLQLNANKVPVDLIVLKLAELKEQGSWLYAELLSHKAPYKGLDFVSYLIKSNKADVNKLLHWITLQLNSKDVVLVKKVASTLRQIVRNDNINALISSILKKRGIDTLSGRETVAKIVTGDSFKIISSIPFKKFRDDLKKSKVRQVVYAQ